jgi:hypothetical protein
MVALRKVSSRPQKQQGTRLRPANSCLRSLRRQAPTPVSQMSGSSVPFVLPDRVHGGGERHWRKMPAVLLPLGVPASVNYGGQIAAADFTGDGMPDLATFNSVQGNAVLLVLPGLGGGALGVARTFTTSLAHVETPGSATVAAPLTGGPLSDLAVGVPNVGNYCTVLTTLGNDCR